MHTVETRPKLPPAAERSGIRIKATVGSQTATPKTWSLRRPVTFIGARRHAQIVLHDAEVSRTHAAIVNTGRCVLLADLCSESGTYCNGQRVKLRVLRSGDVVRVGQIDIELEIECRAPAEPPQELQSDPLHMPRPFDLMRLDTGRRIPMRAAVAVLGTRQGADVQFEPGEIALVHSLLFAYGDEIAICDAGSSTPLKLNGQTTAMGLIHHRDRISCGPFELMVMMDGERSGAQSEPDADPLTEHAPEPARTIHGGSCAHEAGTGTAAGAGAATGAGAGAGAATGAGAGAGAATGAQTTNRVGPPLEQSSKSLLASGHHADPAAASRPESVIRSAASHDGSAVDMAAASVRGAAPRPQRSRLARLIRGNGITARVNAPSEAGEDTPGGTQDEPASPSLSSARRSLEATASRADETTADAPVSAVSQQPLGIEGLEARIAAIQNDLAHSWAQLATRQQAIEKRSKELDHQERKLMQLADELQRRAAELEQREQAVAERQNAIELRKAELDRRDTELAHRETELTARSAEMEALGNKLGERKLQLRRLAEECQTRQRELDAAAKRQAQERQELEQQQQAHESARRDLDTREKELQEQARLLEERAAKLERQQEAVLMSEQKVLHERKQLDQHEAGLGAYEQKLRKLRGELAARERSIASKLTAVDQFAQFLEQANRAYHGIAGTAPGNAPTSQAIASTAGHANGTAPDAPTNHPPEDLELIRTAQEARRSAKPPAECLDPAKIRRATIESLEERARRMIKDLADQPGS